LVGDQNIFLWKFHSVVANGSPAVVPSVLSPGLHKRAFPGIIKRTIFLKLQHEI